MIAQAGFEKQQDGRFHHMLRLFAEDKIATLAMNAIDSRGFQELKQTLETVRNKIPELENAKVGTAFLANLAYVLDKEVAYGPKGPAIKNGLFPALENLSLLGNPYFVCGKERMYDHLHSTNDIDWRDHMSAKLGRENINAPTNAQYREYRNRHPHSSEFKEMTVGGYLDTLTAHFHTLREKDVKRRSRATSPYGPHSARAGEYKESNGLRSIV